VSWFPRGDKILSCCESARIPQVKNSRPRRKATVTKKSHGHEEKPRSRRKATATKKSYGHEEKP
jgi:hypothetical protein